MPGSGYCRHGSNKVTAPSGVVVRKTISGPAIYGGFIHRSFGHFICETPARLWFAKQHPEMPILCSGGGTVPRGYKADLFKVLGIENPTMSVREVTAVDGDLYLPEAGHELGSRLHPEHAAFLGVWPRKGRRPRRVWLSRSAYARSHGVGMHVEDEIAIEQQLAEQGWVIWHPERHRVPKQLNMLSAATEIAGFIGSAFHLLLFLEEVQAKVTIFAGDQTRNRSYEIIAETKRFDQTIVPVKIDKNRLVGGPAAVLMHLRAPLPASLAGTIAGYEQSRPACRRLET